MPSSERVLVRPVLAYCPGDPALSSSSARSRGVLTPRERAALAAFPSDKRQRDWLAGRSAAKQAAQRWFALQGRPVKQDDFEIDNDETGKPLVHAAASVPHISLSHCAAGGFAAAHGAPVGVDWEPVAERDPGVIKYYARPGEDVSTPAAQTGLWTVKEAVLKMLGLGLSGGLDNVHWNGKKVSLFGTAKTAWEKTGAPNFTVDQWIDGETSLAVAYTEVQP